MGRLVMIVDDHAIIRRMLRALLEAEDLQVSDAMDGAEADCCASRFRSLSRFPP